MIKISLEQYWKLPNRLIESWDNELELSLTHFNCFQKIAFDFKGSLFPFSVGEAFDMKNLHLFDYSGLSTLTRP